MAAAGRGVERRGMEELRAPGPAAAGAAAAAELEPAALTQTTPAAALSLPPVLAGAAPGGVWEDGADDQDMPVSPTPNAALARTVSPPPRTSGSAAGSTAQQLFARRGSGGALSLPQPLFAGAEGGESFGPSSGAQSPASMMDAPPTPASRLETVKAIRRRAGEVSLVVGGRRFVCNVGLFEEHPNTMLGAMFGSSLQSKLTRPNERGDYEITHEVSAAAFKAILSYYEHGRIRCPPNVSVSELHDACNFFMIPFTHKSVHSDNVADVMNKLSSQGARSQFNSFLDEEVVPAMARCAQMGDRECHIVCLTEDDTVEWDDELPPGLGAQYAQVIHSTALVRFLKYHENRRIVKEVLKEKGFNKIKLGIEGFPTFAEKIRQATNGEKVEAVYNYEQRPFVKLSWEKDEIKSRHVDFQCVRAKSLSSHIALSTT